METFVQRAAAPLCCLLCPPGGNFSFLFVQLSYSIDPGPAWFLVRCLQWPASPSPPLSDKSACCSDDACKERQLNCLGGSMGGRRRPAPFFLCIPAHLIGPRYHGTALRRSTRTYEVYDTQSRQTHTWGLNLIACVVSAKTALSNRDIFHCGPGSKSRGNLIISIHVKRPETELVAWQICAKTGGLFFFLLFSSKAKLNRNSLWCGERKKIKQARSIFSFKTYFGWLSFHTWCFGAGWFDWFRCACSSEIVLATLCCAFCRCWPL